MARRSADLRRPRPRGWAGLARAAAWLALLAPAGVAAQPPLAAEAPRGEDPVAEARAYFERGVALADEERWGEALELFRRSLALVDRPSTLYNVGVVEYRLGRVRSAIATLERFLDLAHPREDAQRARAARALLRRLRPAVVELTLAVSPAEASVTVDGEPVPGGPGPERLVPLDPGPHEVAVDAPGHVPARFELSLLPGARERREVRLEVAPPEPATLRVAANVREAVVRVDGREVGRAPVTLDLDPGEHTVEVHARGREPFRRRVSLAAGATHELAASLAGRDRLVDSPWFWVVGGVVVAGLAAGVAAAVVLGRDDPDLPAPSTGVVVQGLLPSR